MQNTISGTSGTSNKQLLDTSSHAATSDQAEKKPRIQSRKNAEIIIDADGRRFRNGIELFYESEIDSDKEQYTPKQPKEKSDEVTSAPLQKNAGIVAESVESRCGRFRSAIKAGDIDAVRQLVTQYPDLARQADHSDAPLLHQAIKDGQPAIAELLVHVGVSPNSQDEFGVTALILAICYKQVSLAEVLIRKGASVSQADKFGKTPLWMAVFKDDTKTLQLLLDCGVDVNQTKLGETPPLYLAAASKRTKAAQLLISKGASINCSDRSGMTPLHLAAARGNEQMARLLIENHARIDLTNHRGWTPLMNAAQDGHLGIVRLLLEEKADIGKKSDVEETAIMLAAMNGHIEIAELLIHAGASIDQADKKGRTPLTFACDYNDTEVLKLFLSKLPNRAAVDARTPEGLTLLGHAARNDHKEIAEILLKFGASIDLAFTENFTALMIAASNGNIDVLKFLIDHGAAIDQRDEHGRTALMIACEEGYAEAVDLLLDKSRFSVTQMGTMVDVAASMGHAKVLEHLFEKAKLSAMFSKAMLKAWKTNPAESAIKNGHPEALAVLLKNGIHPDPASETVWKSLMNAADNGNAEILRLALDEFSSSLPLSSSSWLGRGPSPIYLRVQQSLIHAVRQNRQDIVRLLIKAGAKPDFLDKKAQTAVQVAIQKRNPSMLQLLLGPGVKLTKKHLNDRLSSELLLAIGGDPPDPLIIDCLIDFDTEEKTKKDGFSFALDYPKLSDKVIDLLMAALESKDNHSLQGTAMVTMLCAEFGLRYPAANTLANTLREIADIYARDLVADIASPESTNLPKTVTPTAAQLRMAFAESIASSQLLQDLMRFDGGAPELCYPTAALAPELAKKLARSTAQQTGLLVVAADSLLSESQSTLARFLNMLRPTTTSRQIRGFMRSAGWHPMLGELVAECWDSLDKTRTKSGLAAAISQRLLTPEFAEKLEHRTSDAARHYLQVQLNRLTEIIQG